MKLIKRMLIKRLLIYKIAPYGIVFSLCFVCIGCSSKTDKENKNKKPPSQAVSKKQVKHVQTPLREEAKLVEQKTDDLNKPSVKAIDRKKKIRSKLLPAREKPSIRHPRNKNKDRDEVNAVIAEYRSANSVERKIELIESLSLLNIEQNPAVITIVQETLDDPNRELGRAAIELLSDYNTPDILPVIAKALTVADDETRVNALTLLRDSDDPQAGLLLIQALDDPSEDVRTEALEAVGEQGDPIKLSIMEKGISSPYTDVKNTVIPMLEERGDHRAVEILIEGLKDSDPAFREKVNEALNFLVDEEFKTYEEAQQWWATNKSNFDDELIRVEDK
jgi:hypothetical protein